MLVGVGQSHFALAWLGRGLLHLPCMRRNSRVTWTSLKCVLGSNRTMRRNREAFNTSLNSQKVFPDRSSPVKRWRLAGIEAPCLRGKKIRYEPTRKDFRQGRRSFFHLNHRLLTILGGCAKNRRWRSKRLRRPDYQETSSGINSPDIPLPPFLHRSAFCSLFLTFSILLEAFYTSNWRGIF
jgi:hypothetical protein